MSDKSKIEWTDATWNPVRGCEKVSPGCRGCYAIRTALRFSGPGQPYEGLVTSDPPNWSGVVRFVPEKLAEPYEWRRPRLIFVNSMSDLFHGAVTREQIAAVFGVMALCGHHTFQVLTKRIERAAALLPRLSLDECLDAVAASGAPFRSAKASRAVAEEMRKLGRDPSAEEWPLPNVFVGPSIENQETADERMPHACRIAQAGWRVMVSAEPMLGPIDLRLSSGGVPLNSFGVPVGPCGYYCDERVGHVDHQSQRISWLIVGGESGDDARPLHPQWARSLRDQCAAAGVPFLFKQWGEWAPALDHDVGAAREVRFMSQDGSYVPHASGLGKPSVAFVARVGKAKAGRLLDGREHNEFPSVGAVTA